MFCSRDYNFKDIRFFKGIHYRFYIKNSIKYFDLIDSNLIFCYKYIKISYKSSYKRVYFICG